MTEQDKLVELLEQEKAFSRFITDEERREKLAEYLLQNGVIVPPCKVGDTVYFINDFIKEDPVINVLIIDALHITSGKNKLGNKRPSFALARDKLMNFLSKRLSFDIFGKTVFLTREEAEKALKERENNEGNFV